MTTPVPKKPKIRRTPEQRAAEYQRKANKARAQATKLKRAADGRRNMAVGKTLLEIAESGDAEAIRLLERIDAMLAQNSRPDAQPGPAPTPSEAAIAEMKERIEAALSAHNGSEGEARKKAAQVWRRAVVDWEQATGKMWIKPEKRAQAGLGGLGQILEGY